MSVSVTLTTRDDRATVDYVVVGAGSAGCVLANRLTADGETTVLLLEAGGPDDAREISIPAAFSELFRTDADWAYDTVPQPNLNDRECYWPRGKTLGGSSAMNAMLYVRGHPTDFDRWAERGNDGWAYDEVLPYFKRAERNDRLDDEYHGTDGPRNVTDLRSPNELTEAFVEAAAGVGFPRNDDFNGARQAGVGRFQVTQKGGKRHSAADAYLKPALDRSNLRTRTGATVTRVLFDGTRATGVEYRRGGETVRVDADAEVILSAGAVNSPHLLLLSGVGPAGRLESHGIDVVADRPGVGRNLQDHLIVPAVYESTEPVSLDDADGLLNLLRYLLFKRGPLTSNVAEAGAFERTDPDLPAPDLQYHFGPAYFVDHGFEERDGHHFAIGPTLIRPESRGEIRLRSADPLDDPLVDPNYLDREADLGTLVYGIERAREIAAAAPFDRYRGTEVYPGPDATDEAGIAAHVREKAQTLYHPVGTCAMGEGQRSVVDDRLRVRGVTGLRVADASVMPKIVGGNTEAATAMIAEKAADLVLADASGRSRSIAGTARSN